MPTYTTTESNGDVILAQIMPEAEYMYGCTPTAVAMILGYYDLYGYRGTSLSNMIEGDVDPKSRGTDGNAYNMNAFDTVLGRAIATESFVSRFHAVKGKETTPKQELKYTFKSDNRTINTDVWDCIADYLGTGQYWRGNDNLSTTVSYCSLEDLYRNDTTTEITSGSTKRTVRYIDTSMMYGLDLYVQSRGYTMDYEISGSYLVDTAGGDFTFADYMKEIDSGRPVMISIEGHSMVGYGYNADTQEIIFDDCYVSGKRMKWTGTYRFDKVDRRLQSITVIGINVGSDVDLAIDTLPGSSGETIIAAGTPDAQESMDYCFVGTDVYLSFHVSNLGTEDSGKFSMTVLIDGATFSLEQMDSIAGESSRDIAAFPLGKLSAGMHGVRIVLDEANDIQERTATNNTAETDILVLKQETVIVPSGQTVTADSNETLRDVYVRGGAGLTLKGGKAFDTILNGTLTESGEGSSSWIPGEVTVSQGGYASGTDVCGYGRFTVSSGGSAADTRIRAMGSAFVQDGGTASDTNVESGGRLTVSSGGKLTGQIQIADGASVKIYSGGTLNFDLSDLTPDAAARVNDLSRLNGSPAYTLTVSGTQAHGTYRLADGADKFRKTITVLNTEGIEVGTLAIGEILNWNDMGFVLTLDSGALSLTVSDRIIVDSVAPTVFNLHADITAPTWRNVTVTAEFADDVELASKWYRIGGDGVWTEYDDGVTVSENAIVYFKAVDAAGNESEIASCAVSNITSSGCVFSEGESVDVLSGRIFTDSVLSGGSMHVSAGGTAAGTTVNSDGTMEIMQEGAADGVTVNDGGRIVVNDGGTVTGQIVFASGADVSFSPQSILDFDISDLKPGAEDAPVNGLSHIQEPPLYTLTVSGSQAKGLYRLASDAGEFDSEVSIRNTSGSLLGMLATGQTVNCNGAGYSLNRSDNMLTLTVGTAGVDNGADCGWNNWLYDRKTKLPNLRIRDSVSLKLNDGTTEIQLDSEGSVLKDDKRNFVGFGDEADYLKITLDSAAKLSFTVSATDAAKFVIYRLIEGTDKKGNPTYTLKAVQTTSLVKKYSFTASTKSILLESDVYYISMQSTNAKKAGSAYYSVKLCQDNGRTVFYSDGDSGDNNWLYDKKTKGLNLAVTDADGITMKPGEILIDDSAPSGEDAAGWNNFVGFGDDTDFAKLNLSGTATVSFMIRATDAAKFIIYRVVEGVDRKGNPTYTLKAVQTAALKRKKGETDYTATTRAIQLQAAENWTYCIAMQSTNAKKGGSAYYNVTLDTFVSAADSAALLRPVEDQDVCAPAMPGSTDAGLMNMQDSLPAGTQSAPGMVGLAGFLQTEDNTILPEPPLLA